MFAIDVVVDVDVSLEFMQFSLETIRRVYKHAQHIVIHKK